MIGLYVYGVLAVGFLPLHIVEAFRSILQWGFRWGRTLLGRKRAMIIGVSLDGPQAFIADAPARKAAVREGFSGRPFRAYSPPSARERPEGVLRCFLQMPQVGSVVAEARFADIGDDSVKG